MKVYIVAAALMCAVSAAPQFYQPQQFQPPVPILKSSSEHQDNGSYQYEYETGNGIHVAENGYVKNAGYPGQESLVVQGYYQYVGADGAPVYLSYVADERGFVPQGNHLPTTPAPPQELQEAFARVLADPRTYDGDDGQYRPQNYKQG